VLLSLTFAFLLACGIDGNVLLSLTDGDYVQPRLSPDGKQLAVSRAFERADGNETTEVVVFDVATGREHEVLSRAESEKYEVYESYVQGLSWLDATRIEVQLGDGDVGSTTLTIDVNQGKVLREQGEEGDLVPAEMHDVLAGARAYRAHFTRQELETSLGSAIRLPSGRVFLERKLRGGLFLIEPKKRRLVRIGDLPSSLELRDATERDGEVLFVVANTEQARLDAYRDGRVRTLATWLGVPRDQRAELRFIAPQRTFIFMRPYITYEPASATLRELVDGQAVPRSLGPHADDFSVSADGSRFALSEWAGTKRNVCVVEGWSFR
jgi:dipeptidyl aminopeptidase/acylaminoacyl peptidase